MAILIVPMEWFITPPDMVLKLNLLGAEEHRKLLRLYGCSEYALQWLRDWSRDFQYDAMLYRFVSGNTAKQLPFVAFGSPAPFLEVELRNELCKNTSQLLSTIPEQFIAIEKKGRRIARI